MEDDSEVFNNKPGTDNTLPWLNELSRERLPGPKSENNKMLSGNEGFSTLCVHQGTYEDKASGAIGTPIFPTTTFQFSSTTYDSFLEGFVRDIPTYTRYGNPNQWSVQLKIAALESAQSALILASGMAAITTTLVALTNNGGHIISSYDLYGGSYSLLRSDMHQMGRTVSYVDPLDISSIESEVREQTQVIFLETLSNPLMKAVDLCAIANICRQNNILLIVDNTFLTPASCKPLEHGADIVIHSGTKYLNGHSDVTCGAACGSRKLVDRIWAQMLKFGGSLDPFACFLLERGLKTLAIRMKAHKNGAKTVAQFLQQHEKILKVYSPYYEPQSQANLKQYSSDVFCGMLSFEVAGGNEAALKLLSHLQFITAATSLGGVESLISLPFNTSHSGLTAEQQKKIGLNTGLVRLSVGIEDPQDLCNDLEQALFKVYAEDA